MNKIWSGKKPKRSIKDKNISQKNKINSSKRKKFVEYENFETESDDYFFGECNEIKKKIYPKKRKIKKKRIIKIKTDIPYEIEKKIILGIKDLWLSKPSYCTSTLEFLHFFAKYLTLTEAVDIFKCSKTSFYSSKVVDEFLFFDKQIQTTKREKLSEEEIQMFYEFFEKNCPTKSGSRDKRMNCFDKKSDLYLLYINFVEETNFITRSYSTFIKMFNSFNIKKVGVFDLAFMCPHCLRGKISERE